MNQNCGPHYRKRKLSQNWIELPSPATHHLVNVEEVVDQQEMSPPKVVAWLHVGGSQLGVKERSRAGSLQYNGQS